MNKRGAYNKAWNNFIDKLYSYQDIEIIYWSEYQLLGYWSNLSGIEVEQPTCEYRKHPQLQQMRYIIKKLCFPNWKSRGANDIPKQYDSQLVVSFLKWSIEDIICRKLKLKSICFLSGDKSVMIERFLKHKKTESFVFDPSKLDF